MTMLKGALLLAVIGALSLVAFSCPVSPYYSCVRSHKPEHCTAIQVCENSKKEPCGESYCEYPYTCASIRKSVCKDFCNLQQKCEYKKVCRAVKIPCGSGACNSTHDCVKENHCYVKRVPTGRKLMGDSSGKAGSLGEKSGGNASGVKSYKEVNVCEDQYSCVAKDPCKDITIRKCVRDVLRPGIDYSHGGFDFSWYSVHASQKCGTERCRAGYKCAEVIIKKCAEPCGNQYCNAGEECVANGKECEDYAYLSKVCKDVYEPTCVPLSPYMKLHYKPPCKTVYKCEEDPAECGGKYCPKGYTCEVSYKKSCGVVHKPTSFAKATTVFSIVGVPYSDAHASSHSGAQSGAHASVQATGTPCHSSSYAASLADAPSRRRLDFYPGAPNPNVSSAHSYAEAFSRLPNNRANAGGVAAGGLYLNGPGQGNTNSDVNATTEEDPNGGKRASVNSSSSSTVNSTG